MPSSASRAPGVFGGQALPFAQASARTFLPLCHRRQVAALCMLYKVNSNSNHCLFSEHRFAISSITVSS